MFGIRELFTVFTEPPKPRLQRVIRSNGVWIPFSLWQKQEEARIAAETLRNAKMPPSETYDLTFRRPASEKTAGYDFTF